MRNKVDAVRKLFASHPYRSLSLFVIIVIAVSVAGYARYQHVQAEIAAQRPIAAKIQRGFSDWRDDLSQRLIQFQEGIQGTAQGAKNVVGGAWGIISYLVTAVLDFTGNLHIMIPVTVIYFGVGFFGTLKMRVATLIGALIAFLISTSIGIVPGSIIGLLAMAGLLLWNRIDPRLLANFQGLPTKLKANLKQMRDKSGGHASPKSEPIEEAPDSPV